MGLNQKINEIRNKPEHIRMRYVWGAVAIAMFFIIIIWLFSLQETFKSSAPKSEDSASLKNQWESARENMPSIQEFMESQNNIQNEIAPQNNNETGTSQ